HVETGNVHRAFGRNSVTFVTSRFALPARRPSLLAEIPDSKGAPSFVLRLLMTTHSLQSAGYLPIATAGLTPSSVLSCDLFIQRPGRTFAELFRGQDYPIAADDLNHLRESGIDHLYIRLADAEAYRAYLCEHVLHEPTIPLAVRMNALREVTRVAFEDAFTAGDCAKVVDVASNFGSDLANMVADQSPAFGEL